MVGLFFIFPILLRVQSFDLTSDMDPFSAMQEIAKIKDDISVDLTDDNFDELTVTGRWFVYFFHPD
jgi:hypothetical protein